MGSVLHEVESEGVDPVGGRRTEMQRSPKAGHEVGRLAASSAASRRCEPKRYNAARRAGQEELKVQGLHVADLHGETTRGML